MVFTATILTYGWTILSISARYIPFKPFCQLVLVSFFSNSFLQIQGAVHICSTYLDSFSVYISSFELHIFAIQHIHSVIHISLWTSHLCTLFLLERGKSYCNSFKQVCFLIWILKKVVYCALLPTEKSRGKCYSLAITHQIGLSGPTSNLFHCIHSCPIHELSNNDLVQKIFFTWAFIHNVSSLHHAS